MRAITVCVDYADILAVTLAHNKHHFTDLLIVTTTRDTDTISLCSSLGAISYTTDAFYRNGAHFNKWLALEEGLSYYGRHSLLCILDADIVFPEKIQTDYDEHKLYTPKRRMNTNIFVPPESEWDRFPYSANTTEFSGYTQIFYATDRHLPKPPWHQTNWKHAGGADTFFQNQWPDEDKIRPDFEVLHLGEPGTNWCGRSEAGKKQLDKYMQLRKRIRKSSRTYENEKLPIPRSE